MNAQQDSTRFRERGSVCRFPSFRLKSTEAPLAFSLCRNSLLPLTKGGITEDIYLPHCDLPNLIQFVTWRLADSIPKPLLDRAEQELRCLTADPAANEAARREYLERILDRGFGNCWLRRASCAEVVRECLLERDGKDYELHTWVIMPNHLHVLVRFRPEMLMGDVIEQWKAVSAKGANKVLQRSGPFWQEDYWDRYIRDAAHYEEKRRYILLNPVKAGLVKHYSQWPWLWTAGKKEPL